MPGIELVIVTEDPLFAEGEAPGRRKISRYSRTLRNAVVQRDYARNPLFEPRHRSRERVAQSGDDLEQGKIYVAEPRAHQMGVSRRVAFQHALEVAEEFWRTRC